MRLGYVAVVALVVLFACSDPYAEMARTPPADAGADTASQTADSAAPGPADGAAVTPDGGSTLPPPDCTPGMTSSQRGFAQRAESRDQFTLSGGGLLIPNGGARPWVDLNGLTTSDDSAASTSFAGSTESEFLYASNFGFSLPRGSLVRGVEVMVERKSPKSLVLVTGVVREGRLANTRPGAALTPDDTVDVLGSADDLWGITFAAEQVNAPEFGVAFYAASPETPMAGTKVFVDSVEIRVFFVCPQ